MTQRKRTDFVAIHCSDTKPSMHIGEDEIREWHKARKWSDIGYNVVIRRSGLVEIGRPIDSVGAHVLGYNSRSLGVCLVGGQSEDGKPENNFTLAQFDSLVDVIKFLWRYAPGAVVQGHRDFPNVAKDCPCFDVKEWLKTVGLV